MRILATGYCILPDFFFNLHHFGELAEWLKAHAWKACIPQKGIGGSNPSFSAFLFHMSRRNFIAFILIIASLICLYPGLVKPILSINIGVDLPIIGNMELHDTKQSILDTIGTLHRNNNTFVASLILLFSVVIPVLKALMLLTALFTKRLHLKSRLHKLVSLIGKWSMADVFVVGVMIAFLATSSDDNIHAALHEGFYYFLAYCVISILSYQVMRIEVSDKI